VSLLGALLFAGQILKIIYGDFYRSGASILVILMIGLLFRFIGGSSQFALMMTGQGKITMWISVFSTMLMITLAIGSGIRYGSVAVAWSVTAAAIFQNLSYLYFVKKKLGISSLPVFEFSKIRSVFENLKGRFR
jgi:O-antigen/teichoic acid export membrane protein